MTRRQCEKCPWKRNADPRQIPNGYCEKRHRDLRKTIAGDSPAFGGPLRIMACHESPVGAEVPCVGWLLHQLGPGNNIGLRLAAARGRIDVDVETVGPQHERFEDTLP